MWSPNIGPAVGAPPVVPDDVGSHSRSLDPGPCVPLAGDCRVVGYRSSISRAGWEIDQGGVRVGDRRGLGARPKHWDVSPLMFHYWLRLPISLPPSVSVLTHLERLHCVQFGAGPPNRTIVA